MYRFKLIFGLAAIFIGLFSTDISAQRKIVTIDGRMDELMFHEKRKWLGDDGLPYREENVKGKLSPHQETYHMVKIYGYDPNIKIEAPIK